MFVLRTGQPAQWKPRSQAIPESEAASEMANKDIISKERAPSVGISNAAAALA